MDYFSTVMSLLVVILSAVILLRKKNKTYPPVATTVFHQLLNASRVHNYVTELACKYRTYRVLDLYKFAVYAIDPANVEYVLKANSANYGKGVYLHSILSDVLGDGIFTLDGDNWLHQRKASSSQLSTILLKSFSSEIFKTNADSRVCYSDDTLPDGLGVKKGEVVVYLPYARRRMKFLWGNDAEEFRPERWLDENDMFKDESPSKYITFNMKVFCAVLLGSYIFKLSDQEKVVNYRIMITLHIEGGLHVHATPRLRDARA